MASLTVPIFHVWFFTAALCRQIGALQTSSVQPEEAEGQQMSQELRSDGVLIKVSQPLAKKALLQGDFDEDSHQTKHLPAHLYQSADALIEEVKTLGDSGKCAVPFSTTWEADTKDPKKKLFVARLGHSTATKGMLIVSNEHAREAITAEVSKSFIKWACAGSKSAQLLFASMHITMVPVVNLAGRRLVDDGSRPCQRFTADEGEGEIDLNRNMDVDFEAGGDHGAAPFSTYQARILRRLAADEKPLAYVDLHSGFNSLMVPWGSRSYTTADYPDQKKLLDRVAKGSCPKCKMGSNCKVIGYRNPGEIIDHMYQKQGIKYSTLWEIYNGKDESNCLEYFNPLEKKAYDATVARWTRALQTFTHGVRRNVKVGERSTPAPLGKDPIAKDGQIRDTMLTQLGEKQLPLGVDAVGSFLTT